MMRIQLLLLIFAVTLAGGCANKVAPTGGVKDVVPPSLLKASPEDNSVNFSSASITSGTLIG